MCTIISDKSKQKGKVRIDEEEKFEMPSLKKVTKIASKDQEEEHEVISLRKMIKPPPDEEQPPLGIILKSVEKTETYEKITAVYSEALAEVTVTSQFESERDTFPYGVTKRTEAISGSFEKKIEEQVQVIKSVDDLPKVGTEKPVEVVDKTSKDEKAEEKYGVKKTTKKTLKEDQPDTPSLQKKKVAKLPLKEQEQETVMLKPFAKPEKPDEHEVEKARKDKDREHAIFQRSERALTDKPARDQAEQFPAKQRETEVRTKEESLVTKDDKANEKTDIKKSKTPKDEEESQAPGLVRKKVSKLPSDEKEQEIVKLKPVPKSAKEVEKKVQDSAVDGREREQIEFTKGERSLKDDTHKEPLSTPSELPKSKITDKPLVTEQQKQKEEKAGVQKTKALKDEETKDPSLVRKKITRLPSNETEQEIVKLKPFEKPAKQDIEKERKESTKEPKEREAITFKKSEIDSIKEPGAEIKQSERPKDTVPEKLPGSGKVTDDQKVEGRAALKKVNTPKGEEEPKAPSIAPKKISKLPLNEKEPETVKLKPIDKHGKPESDEVKPEKKIPEKERDQIAIQRDQTPKEKVVKEPEKQPMKVEKLATPDKVPETTEKKDKLQDAGQKPSPKKLSPVKKSEMSPKTDEKPALQKKSGQLPKDSKEKEEITLKPVELAKKIEMKKTPSPQVSKPGESVPMERKPSGDIKRLPKKVSPKDSIESVTLKKVTKKVSPPEKPSAPEEAVKAEKEKLPVTKALSPEVVQMRKISTQYEEEVEEFHAEVQEEEDSWGWELVPSDDWEGELEEGAVETPGFGGRRGESLVDKYQH